MLPIRVRTENEPLGNKRVWVSLRSSLASSPTKPRPAITPSAFQRMSSVNAASEITSTEAPSKLTLSNGIG